MAFFRLGNFQLGLLLATALATSMGSSASHAYTPEQEQARVLAKLKGMSAKDDEEPGSEQ